MIEAIATIHHLPLVLKVHELVLKVVLFLLILELTVLHHVKKGLLLLQHQHSVLFLDVPLQVVRGVVLLLSHRVELHRVHIAHLVLESLVALRFWQLVVPEGNVLAIQMPVLLEVRSRH